MDIRKLFLSVAATAAISPSIATAASPQDTALQACASAFAAKIASPGTAAPSFKLQYSGSQSESAVEEYYGHDFTFYLRAHDKKTGVTLARATCSADTHGAVTALTTTEVGNANLAKTF
jgi:hypothetical protein